MLRLERGWSKFIKRSITRRLYRLSLNRLVRIIPMLSIFSAGPAGSQKLDRLGSPQIQFCNIWRRGSVSKTCSDNHESSDEYPHIRLGNQYPNTGYPENTLLGPLLEARKIASPSPSPVKLLSGSGDSCLPNCLLSLFPILEMLLARFDPHFSFFEFL